MYINKCMALLVGLLLASQAIAGPPCDTIKRGLSESQRVEWTSAIAKQLNVSSVKILQVFNSHGWSIVYVGTPNSDPPFLFFRGTPDVVHFLTLWSGAAQPDEENDIRVWVEKNAPGIPSDLGKCFAWHVTKDRGR